MHIIVTERVNQLIRAHAQGDSFQATGVRQPNGDVAIPISEDTYRALLERCLPRETYSDCIERVFAINDGKIN